MQNILDIFGMIALTGGIAGAVATALVKVFGERWIGSKFDKELERFRDQQTRELEHLRYQMSGLLDRTTKLNDREFEVVPEAWAKLVDAYYTALQHVSSFKRFPPLDAMSPAQLHEFLEGTQLLETQKADLRISKDKVSDYSKMSYWHDKAHADGVAREFNTYIEKFGLFIRSKAEFEKIGAMIWAALTEHELAREDEIRPDPGQPSARQTPERDGRVAMKALEVQINGGLWSTDLTPRPTNPKVPTA